MIISTLIGLGVALTGIIVIYSYIKSAPNFIQQSSHFPMPDFGVIFGHLLVVIVVLALWVIILGLALLFG